MRFKPDNVRNFRYKGYDVTLKKHEGSEHITNAIEITLVLRSTIYQTMTLCFLINNRKKLFYVLKNALKAFDKAERKLK
jgi:hypothetical protein